MEKNIAVIWGDCSSPEIVKQTIRVLDKVAEKYGHTFHYTAAAMGGEAIDKYGDPLPQHELDKCLAADSVLLGAVGAPVFAGFRGGVASLLGTTGGYLVGFVLLTLIITFAQAHWGQGQWVFVLSAAVGLLVCYAFGTAWFMALYARAEKSITLAGALSLCVVPYLLPDLVKVIFAAALVAKLKKYMKI